MKFKSQLVTVASGKLDGLVASHNKGGNYFRALAIPTNPNTSRQASVRGWFGSAVQAWTDLLSDSQRGAWNSYAQQTPVTNVFGDAIQLSGQQMYIRTVVVALQLGRAITTVHDAPTINNTGEPPAGLVTLNDGVIDAIGIDATDLSVSVQVPGGTSDDGDLLLQFGSPVNSGVTGVRGPFQFAYRGETAPEVAAMSTGVTVDTTVADLTIDTELAIGQRRPVRARILYDDNRLSQPLEILAPVVDDSAA